MRPLVVSLTTTPARNGTLWETIASLAAQTRPPDAIHLYVTPGCDPLVAHPLVRCFLVPDRGPVTKLFAVAHASLPDDTLIVTVDDDQSYAPTWLATLEAAAAAAGDAAVGFSGWNFGPESILIQPFNGPVDVTVLEGWAGAAYRKDFFGPDVLEPPLEHRRNDDVWISLYLHRRQIRRLLCGPPMLMPRIQPVLPGLHNLPDATANTLRAAKLGWPR